MPKHAAPYASADKDEAASSIYRYHGYLIASLMQYGGYGRHREGGNPVFPAYNY